MRAYEFLFEDIWSDVVANWVNTGIDLLTVEANVNKFKQLKNKNLLSGIEKDIQFWKNKPFAQFVAFIDANAAKLDATKGAIRAKIKQSSDEIVLDDTPDWLVVVPLSMAASQKLGSGTNWCTSTRSENNYFDQHTLDNLTTLIYIISKTTNEKYAIRFQNKTGKVVECRDKNNSGIGHEFQEITGIDAYQLITQCRANKKWQEFIRSIEQRKIEKILQTGDVAIVFDYAKNFIKGRWPEGEAVIASNPKWAYCYATDVIKGRWPEGEAVISSDPRWADLYATDVIKGRWPEGEKAIASDPMLAYQYAYGVINGRFPEGEAVIASNPQWAYKYARDIIKGRFPEGEAVIASNPQWAYCYASDCIHGRWPEGEKAIASDPEWAAEYKDFLKSIGEK